jgi:hypothetical protein
MEWFLITTLVSIWFKILIRLTLYHLPIGIVWFSMYILFPSILLRCFVAIVNDLCICIKSFDERDSTRLAIFSLIEIVSFLEIIFV